MSEFRLFLVISILAQRQKAGVKITVLRTKTVGDNLDLGGIGLAAGATVVAVFAMAESFAADR